MSLIEHQPRADFSVDWEGDLFQHHSLSQINRALCSRLLKKGLDLAVRANDLSLAPPGSADRALFQDALDRPRRSPTITVRHSWPPKFTPSPDAHWVHIQPWEFGGVPDAWADALKRATEVWSYSSWVRDRYVEGGIDPNRAVVVPCGVETDLFKPDGPRYNFAVDRSFRFLFVGGFIYRKGVDLLLKAYADAFGPRDDVCLVLKGFGAGSVYANGLHREVRAFAAGPGRPAVELIEDDLPNSQMADLYRSCDVLVHPYRGEGFAMPVAEAMASGLPVVVTEGGATSDYCHEDSAWMLPSRRAPVPEVSGMGPSSRGYWFAEPDVDHLTGLLRELPSLEAASAAKAVKARERIVPAYSWDAVADLVTERLCRIAAQPPTRPKTAGKKARPKRGRVTSPGKPANGAGPQARGGPLLSACLIVKDEEKALPECLESLRGLVDEVVVYDTGSTDNTVALAKGAGATVIEGYWDDDFSRARNAALEHCRGEWALWIDADERIRHPGGARVREVLGPLRDDALAVDIYNLGDDPSATDVNVHRALRIFRKSRCVWYGTLHEQVDLRAGAKGPFIVRPLRGAHIDHIGYRADVVHGRDKLARNLRLAEAALAKRESHPGQEGIAEMNVGRALAAMGRFAEAQGHFDAALAEVSSGISLRATLLFSAQNLVALARFDDVIEQSKRLRDLCEKKGLAYYLEGLARRRLGQASQAIELFRASGDLSNEDGFVFPSSMLRAELAGALLEAGRPGEAADELAILVEESPEVPVITTALKAFAAAGKSLEDLAAAVPENRLEKVAAALILVPAVLADPVAEALFRRFGPKPQLLAAAIRFAPMISPQRGLEWSARLRQIGMAEPCPLIAQARLELLEVPARVRAAATAHAAFGDERGAQLALALSAGLHEDQLSAAVTEVSLLDPPLLAGFARAAAGAGAPGAGAVGSPAERRRAVADALAARGEATLSAQIRNEEGLGADYVPAYFQLATLGADR